MSTELPGSHADGTTTSHASHVRKDSAALNPDELRTLKLFKAGLVVAQGQNEADVYAWMVHKGFFPNRAMTHITPKYIEELTIPNQHISLSVNYQDAIKEMWHSILRAAVRTEPLDEQQLLSTILGNVLARELEYQARGRINRNPYADPFRSMVRDHIVLGTPGSMPETTQLYTELRPILLELSTTPLFEEPGDATLPTDLISLGQTLDIYDDGLVNAVQNVVDSGPRKVLGITTAIWEIRHPGEKFFPETQAV